MSPTISRADLLRGRRSQDRPVFRPPWAAESRRFADLCDACGKCADACPEGIIRPGARRLPEVGFGDGACTFCGACAEACPTGALARPADDADAAPWALIAAVGAACLSVGGVTCRVCGDRCDARALRFRPAGGGRWYPDIDEAACTGCGACVGPCPVGAVSIIDSSARENTACA